MTRGKKVLVVDDMPSMRRVVISLLRESGYTTVVEAENGDQGLHRLRHEPFDCVVTDWNMPVKSGIDMLREIRSDPLLQHLPVLLVTAEASRENVIAAAKAGASGYIVKPFAAGTLADKMEQIMRPRPARP